MKPQADYLFEASWEVCNKVGGIYTVIKSKTNLTRQHYRNYFVVGPYFAEKASIDFQPGAMPDFLNQPFEELKSIGVVPHFGKWVDAEGEPFAILLDCSGFAKEKDTIKAQLWEQYQIDSLGAGWDFEEPSIWSRAVGILLAAVGRSLEGKSVVVQCHEWLSAGAILYLKHINSRVATVFTTHATMLGRSIAGSGDDLYALLDHMDPEKEAYKHQVQAKFLTERAVAHAADVFTTVSETTGMEAEKILHRKPDVLTLNGLDIDKFPTIEETSIKHVTCRERIREFLTFYFFPYYAFDLDENLTFFIMGRNEFRNKGLDIFIKALGELNRHLMQQKTARTISVFFWIPLGQTGVKTEILENKNYYQHIKSFVYGNDDEILKRITYDFLLERNPSKESIFTKKFILDARKNIAHFKRKGNPPLCTHNLIDEQRNEIIQALLREGLDNREDDKVKAILYPVYLDGNDGLINLNLYDCIAGSHLGVFPSYYEPWGYTPLESIALGTAAVTSDLAGFGRFIQPFVKHKNPGLWVLPRLKKAPDQELKAFVDILQHYTDFRHNERVQNKMNAKNLAALADWRALIRYYVQAHNLALEKASKRS